MWLAFATASYIASSNDTEVLNEMLPFLEGRLLDPAEADAFFQPIASDVSASLFEHCARGIDSCIALSGEHGLPLIGGGDWNDGMNLVGAGGKGESVWLGWLLLRTLVMFAPLAQSRDAGCASRWRAHAALLREALEQEAWDGDWYRRATFDEGTWLGSKDSEECRIDAIAQSWAVLSGAADPVRARAAMASLDKYLVRREDGLALLFTPPFDKGTLDPGYIKGYPPGLRENGGQYSHAAMWAVLAFARLGEANKAVELLSLLNPINHALTPTAVERYKVEPYVVAADVYSVPPHIGRGGWTWYTGAAGWMYRAGLEGILGIRREGDRLIVAPCIPASWPGFKATINVASTHYEISVETRLHRADGISRALLDGAGIPFANGLVSAPLDGGEHTLVVLL
ncbi:N,N'-diacetylchitobiose phosphorylase [compost metagenome]